jgi:UDP-GlcNAc3NAcA epimerase
MLVYNFLIVVGIRPQYIKLAAFLQDIRNLNTASSKFRINPIIVDTGQHYTESLAKEIHGEFNLSFSFQICHQNVEPMEIFANSLIQLNKIIALIESPIDWVIVFGDGTPALIGALSAVRNGIPIAHIESGVNRSMGETEGVNRKLVDALSSVLFCVTENDVKHLKSEGIEQNVFWVGDFSYDFFMEYANSIDSGIDGVQSEDYIFASIHREENLNPKDLLNILLVLESVDRNVIFIAHPRTQIVIDSLEYDFPDKIMIIPPLSHRNVIAAIKGCAYLLTDSGGIIREAYHLGKRCLVRRNCAGWSLLIELGINKRIFSTPNSLQNGISWIEKRHEDRIGSIQGLVRDNPGKFILDTLIKLNRDSTVRRSKFAK